MVRPSVDLPQPDSPTSPSVSPFWIERSTPSTARTWPPVPRRPAPAGKYFFRPRTSSRGALRRPASPEGGEPPPTSPGGRGPEARGGGSGLLKASARLGDPAGRQLRAYRRQRWGL